jgi:hypothetical protein
VFESLYLCVSYHIEIYLIVQYLLINKNMLKLFKYKPSKFSMDNAWTSKPTCANMTLEIPTSSKHRTSRWKTNRAIAIDHVTLNVYKHPIKSCLTRTPPEFNYGLRNSKQWNVYKIKQTKWSILNVLSNINM